MLKIARLSLLLALLVNFTSGCALLEKAAEAKAKRELEQYRNGLQDSPPILPTDSSGTYPKTVELDILDQLLRKYPGRQRVKTVVETRNVEVPGKTIYVPIATKPDTAANRKERDDIVKEMVALTKDEKTGDPLLRQEVQRLKARLLLALNKRGCLPDTTVYFPRDSASFTIKRVDDNHYIFTCTVAPRTIRVPVTIRDEHNDRIAQDMRHYYNFWQFWAAVAVAVCGWGSAVVVTVKSFSRNG